MKILLQCDNYINYYYLFVKNGAILTKPYLPLSKPLFQGDELLDIICGRERWSYDPKHT